MQDLQSMFGSCCGHYGSYPFTFCSLTVLAWPAKIFRSRSSFEMSFRSVKMKGGSFVIDVDANLVLERNDRILSFLSSAKVCIHVDQ